MRTTSYSAFPTPLFGLGLVENTADFVFRANLAATAKQRAQLGIGGRFNTSGNDGTIMKFGWKAQNKSLTVFAGEAYNVEMGITNDVMSNERNLVQGCQFNPTPEDTHEQQGGSDVDAFVDAMRLSAPPTPATLTSHTESGQDLFENVGCALCHSETLTSSDSYNTGMSHVKYRPFSDFALHHMGTNLADGVSQGVAGPDEFRTAPLWGGWTEAVLSARWKNPGPVECNSTTQFAGIGSERCDPLVQRSFTGTTTGDARFSPVPVRTPRDRLREARPSKPRSSLTFLTPEGEGEAAKKAKRASALRRL